MKKISSRKKPRYRKGLGIDQFKRVKIQDRKSLIKKNDDIFRQIVLLRDNSTCQKSGRKANIQVAHIFSRSNLSIRWELDNALCLNAGVHLYWAHKCPDEFLDWCAERLGKKFEILKLKKRYKSPVRIDEIIGWGIYLKQELERRKSERRLTSIRRGDEQDR